MKTLKPVTPFKFTYRVLNRISMQNAGPFDSIVEAEQYASKTYGWEYRFGENTYRISYYLLAGHNGMLFWKEKDRHEPRLALIRIEDEYVVKPEEIKEVLTYSQRYSARHAARYEAADRDHDRAADLIFKKHHPAKLKEDYCSEYHTYHSYWDGSIEGSWTACKNIGHYHSITGGFAAKKMDEAIASFEEETEDYLGFNVKVHARHRFTLNLWNYERSNRVYGASKSWKHNSKRRKQWIPK